MAEAALAIRQPSAPTTPATSTTPGALVVDLARDAGDVHAAESLRRRVLAAEPAGMTPPDDEREPFERSGLHLVAREERAGRPVGVVRLLTQEGALRAGGFRAERVFHLDDVLRRPGRFLELGRVYVDPSWPEGVVLAALFSGLARLIDDLGYRHLIGHAGVDLGQGVAPVRALVAELLTDRPSPEDHRAPPRLPLPNMIRRAATPCPPPPLLRYYLLLGAELCGDAAWDVPRCRAELLLHLSRDRLERHASRRSAR